VEKRLDSGGRRALVDGSLVEQPHPMHRIADRGLKPLLERRRIVGWVGTGRQQDDADRESQLDRELHPAQRRLLASGVGVEAEEESLRQAVQLTKLTLSQRSSHRGDDW